MDAPAELRLIVRKYAQFSQVPPGGDVSQALSNYNTSKLHDGAMAVVQSALQGPGSGELALYVFRRDVNPVWAGPLTERVVPLAGGGAWYRQYNGGITNNISAYATGPTVITAGDPAVTLVTVQFNGSIIPLRQYAILDGWVKVDGGAVAGGIVSVVMETSIDNGMTWAAADTVPPLTLLADQQTVIPLSTHVSVDSDEFQARIQVSCATQNVTIPDLGAHLTGSVAANQLYP
jgi:hypothetical protein